MKVVILCGGEGIRLHNQFNYIPKGLVQIDNNTILWHIMKRYSLFGFNEFILALGKYNHKIRNYFLNYRQYTNDLGLTLTNRHKLTYYNANQEENWKIILANTGDEARTGARVFRCKKYIDTNDFMVTYSDCLSDVDLGKILKQHKKTGKIATVTGIRPPFRYGEFIMRKNSVIDFSPISQLSAMRGFVNGGFMVLNKKIFSYLNPYNECTLENEVFKELAKKSNLAVYKHNKFWQCLDNDREYEYLKKLCEENKRYWLMK